MRVLHAWATNGTLAEYWDAIESTPGLQGGFIWEWWDHALAQTLPDGRTRWAYGGDYGDQPNDGNFCADGLNWPDGRAKPAMREVAFLFSPARVVAGAGDGHVPDGRVRVANRQSFRDLGWLRGRWELVGADGALVATGSLADLAGIGPGDEAEVALEGWQGVAGAGAGAIANDAGARWLTTASRRPLTSPGWAPARRSAGGSWSSSVTRAIMERPQRRLPQRQKAAARSNWTPTASWSTRCWRPARASRCGVRPRTTTPSAASRQAGSRPAWPTRAPAPPEVERVGASVVVHREIEVGSHRVTHRQTFSPLPDGGVHVAQEAVIPPGLEDLPRVGTVLELVPGLERAEWFGVGPHESYPDRKRSGLVGRWRSAVGDLFTPYIRPQEAGGRADVRWIELRNEAGAGARLTMGAPMQVSATHHRASDLAAATHAEELVPRAEVVVHLDAAHRGLGTASCGPDTTEPYLLGPGTYRWQWTLQAV